MSSMKNSEQIGKRILEILNVITLSPQMVGKVLAESQGPMKYRVYQIVRSIVTVWQIEVKHEQMDSEHQEIYDWVKGIDNGKH